MRDRMGWMAKTLRCYWRQLIAVLTPVFLLPLPAKFGDSKETRCVYVILLMCIYWTTEALPVAVTALIPVFALPFLGVLSTKEVSLSYMNDAVLLMVGAITFALAVEQSGLSKRIAFFILLRLGHNPRHLTIVFMVIATFLAMWVNGTVATSLLIPVLVIVLDEVKDNWMPQKNLVIPRITITDIEENKEISWADGEVNNGFVEEDLEQELRASSGDSSNKSNDKDMLNHNEEFAFEQFRLCLYLSVAYGANLGGSAILWSAPSNLELASVLNESFTKPTGMNFNTWMAFNIPTMITCAVFGCVWLQYLFLGIRRCDNCSCCPELLRKQEEEGESSNASASKYEPQSPLVFYEGVVLTLLFAVVFLWIFRDPGNFPGWAHFFQAVYNNQIDVSNTSLLIFIVFLLFLIPANLPEVLYPKSSEPVSCSGCLSWQILQEKIPWGAILVIGAGSAMTEGVKSSELNMWLPQHLLALNHHPQELLLLYSTALTVLSTAILSSITSAEVSLTRLVDVGLSRCSNPLYLMVPTAACCSYAFLLPAASPANAIVAFSGNINTSTMLKAGLGMSVICIVAMNALMNSLGTSVFDVDGPPTWLNSTTSDMPIQC